MGTPFMIVILIAMVGFMWWSTRQQKKQQEKVNDFRQSLQPGMEVATHSGLLATVESVDLDRDIVILNSEGSLSKWRIQAITEPPVIPAYVSDDEVDENGNPLEQKDVESEVPAAADAEATEAPESQEETK
ncbi:preprotein translocase subunit YajC [Alloscardovia macacae]|uniref:Preprotein translocase YajC subunit n=1 Tax=Alloscardovia macacae TaxID=1160091 RepID=A0A1Y2T083_9BIFI|nr:preprotein translocase subunit YajC [Alloscardovia macacae]OTA27522.1 preprotein translocase subunit YajC [Alloscardovia macacae]OTA30170.1 preprotein translocase subunit YajC [Alloscardovia macacae]OZG54462.1 preprotein translocase YajC subunit [Alloscardovia macacae]